MRGTHGWAEIDTERKREILEAIRSGRATRGPSHAELDITDRCNVACYFCNQQDVRTKQQISLEHLTALIDEMAAMGVRSVRLSGGGDPLAHREIGRVLDHLYARRVVVDNLTTNGALLGDALARRLVEHRAREVVFSLNAGDSGDYARMMQVKPAIFERVVENVARLVELRAAGSHPSVVVQFLLDRRNVHDLPKMYDLGRSLQADRLAIGLVLNVPGEHFDPGLLLGPPDGDALRPLLEEILRKDRDEQLLQMFFPVPQWNAMVEEIRREIGATPPPPLFPTAPSFEERNGHCFFGWYTATIRGNGDLYPCCLLMLPDYKPLGNALQGRLADHWKGPEFRRLREEQREILLEGDAAKFDPARHRVIRSQCVEYGACWLKNIYFRGDGEFYRQLAETLEAARRHPGLAARFRRSWEHRKPGLLAAARRALPAGTLLGTWARRLRSGLRHSG
jgi:MoaA/NifB/PqqE/SkfB family radical SAM enzyme